MSRKDIVSAALPALAFDVYGTLVNPLEMDEHLRLLAGDYASEVASLWRQKQLEYSFRRGLMREYRDFGVCTKQALEYAVRSFDMTLTQEQMDSLVGEYQNLRAYPDVVPGLKELSQRGYERVAFSNGMEATARGLLKNAGVMEHLDGVVSVDDVSTFKPAPEVYEHLMTKLGRSADEILLVSSNPFDVIGAAMCGIRTAWIQRSPKTVFDPWGVEPEITAENLSRLAEVLP